MQGYLQKIYDRLKEIGGNQFDHVTISGGNPALIKGIQDLVDLSHVKAESHQLQR
jgi:7-carboxy-7-deazaguanine synthase